MQTRSKNIHTTISIRQDWPREYNLTVAYDELDSGHNKFFDFVAERTNPDDPSNGGFDLYADDGHWIDGELKFGSLADVAEEFVMNLEGNAD